MEYPYLLWVISYGVSVMGYQLWLSVMGYGLSVISYGLSVMGYQLWINLI